MHPVNGKRPIVELVMLQNGKYQPIKFSNNVQVRMHKPYFNELVFQIKFTLSFISTFSEYLYQTPFQTNKWKESLFTRLQFCLFGFYQTRKNAFVENKATESKQVKLTTRCGVFSASLYIVK